MAGSATSAFSGGRSASGGSVSAVHNSLTVQPRTTVKSLITVQGIQFPSTPAVPPTAAAKTRCTRFRQSRRSSRVMANPVNGKLPKPTGPLSPYFPTPFSGPGTETIPYSGNYPLVNAATNSGLVRGGQFNAGGFGDEGLQWQKVHVGGNVQIVHNSLSVHPEGSIWQASRSPTSPTGRRFRRVSPSTSLCCRTQ